MILWLLTSCSGYRFTQQDNPLSQYGIRSLSVPMFYNYSNLPDASADFTRETYRLLTNYSGLKLSSGYNKNSDAVLIGIIKTREKLNETLLPTNLLEAKGRAGNAIGTNRGTFNIPGTTNVRMYLQIILLKKPTEEEMALVKSGIGEQIKVSSRVIFNELMPLEMQYQREIHDIENNINGTNVVGTQNAGLQRKTVVSLAEQAAISIRDTILYAF